MTESTVTSQSAIVYGACPHDCPDTCSMVVTVENGRATKVVGNPDHPFTKGTLCGKVSDYLDRVYSPDRILYPMRRVGAKGSGQFERISWDAALDEICDRFKQIIQDYGAEAILPCSYLGHEGLLNGLTVGDPFFNRLSAARLLFQSYAQTNDSRGSRCIFASQCNNVFHWNACHF